MRRVRAAWWAYRWFRAMRRRGYTWVEIVDYGEELEEWQRIHATKDPLGARRRAVAQLWLDIDRGENL